MSPERGRPPEATRARNPWAWLGAWTVGIALFGAGCGRLSAPGSSTPPTEPGGDLGAPVSVPNPAVGLVSVYPGVDVLGIAWRVDGIVGVAPDTALYIDTMRSTLFDGTPILLDPTERSITVSALALESEHFIGLALENEAGDFVRSGPVLRVRTGDPVYCDAGSSSAAPDGATPETAYANLQSAVIGAFLAGGGNIWIAGGLYPGLRINLPSGVDLYGGFPPDFPPGAERDPRAWPTTLTGLPGDNILNVVPGDETSVIDGLILDGIGEAAVGVNLDGAELELRDVVAIGCDFGAKLRTGAGDGVLREKLVCCSFSDNSIEGVSLAGSFDLLVEACEFDGNLQEGFDGGPLTAPDGERARITLRDCRFSRNGSEGFDVDLAAPEAGGALGGEFEIRVEDCAFEANGLSGFLVDLDFEQYPLWRADVAIRGCETRANGQHGGSLDLDAASSVLIHRLSSSANRGAGLSVTSETHGGTVTVSSSALVGNQGPGARLSSGNFGAVFSHCVIAGNRGGGLVSDVVESVVHSTVFFEQPNPATGVVTWTSVEIVDPVEGPFRNAPRDYTSVTGVQGSDLILSPPLAALAIGVGDVAEVLDDRVLRQVTGVSAMGIQIDPGAGALAMPFLLSIFAPSADDVVEDYELSPSSAARGVGMALPFGAPVDAGVFGARNSGAPGREDLLPDDFFLVVDRLPAWQVPIGALDDFEVVVEGGTPDPSTFPCSIFAIDPAGASVPITFTGVDDRIRVHAPAGGWSDGSILQFHSGLRSNAGAALAVPVAFPLRVSAGG